MLLDHLQLSVDLLKALRDFPDLGLDFLIVCVLGLRVLLVVGILVDVLVSSDTLVVRHLE